MALTPLSLQNYNFSDPAQAKQYQYQLMQFLNGLLSQFNTLQGQFNTQVGPAILTPSFSLLGAIAGSTAVNTNSAQFVLVTFSFSTAATITLNNLANGAIVVMQMNNTNAASRTLNLAATTPSAVAYTNISLTFGGAGTFINMISTGQVFGTGIAKTYVGIADVPGLQLTLTGG